jgi:sulfonate transport system permease protein
MSAVLDPASTHVPRRGRSFALGGARQVGVGVASLALLVAGWSLLYLALRHTRVFPSPGAVAAALWDNRSLDGQNSVVTLHEAAIGYLWGNIIAIVLGIAFVRVRALEKVLMHVAVGVYCVPLVAIGPLLVILLPGESPKEALAALAVFFTTLVAMMIGLRSSDAAACDFVHASGGNAWQTVRFVKLHAALPSLFGGLCIAAPAAILGAIIGEYMGASSGLGVALIQAQSSFEVAQTWAIAIVISAIAAALFALTRLLARVCTPWVGFQLNQGMASNASDPSERRGVVGGLEELGWLLLSVVVVIVLWLLALRLFHLSSYFAKSPLAVLEYVTWGPGAAANRSVLLSAFGVTIVDSALGYVIGTIVATATAVLVSNVAFVGRLLMPVAIALRSVPLVAMAPFIALLFGAGLEGVTVIVGLVVFFPTLVNVVVGLSSAPQATREVVRSFGGSKLDMIGRVDLRYALPSFFASARIAIPSALGGATLAEWLATGRGLGNLLVVSSADSQYGMLWAGAVAIVVFAVACYGLLRQLERALLARFAPQYN